MTDARTINDVALFLGVSDAAASKVVDRLVRRKLLPRTEGHPDRREIHLSLTESSRCLLAAYDEEKNASWPRFLADIQPRTCDARLGCWTLSA